MRIAEIFRSLQGEGLLTGTESIFVRTSGCNLRCSFCDTRYASWEPEGDAMSIAEIVAQVSQLSGRNDSQSTTVTHAVLTGGEPMIVQELPELCDQLRRLGMYITIETAGTRYLRLECDLMSISPKLSNSTPHGLASESMAAAHERGRIVPDVLRRLNNDYDCQFKFVVDTPADFTEVEQLLERFPEIERNKVMLMPQGIDVVELAEKALWLSPYCDRHGMTYCPRRHIELYGCVRGT